MNWLTKQPWLLRFLLQHAAYGFLLSAVAVYAIIRTDVSGIGTLIAKTEGGWLAAFLLFSFLGSTLMACQITFALLLNLDDPEADG